MDEPNLTLQMQSAKYISSTCKWLKFLGIIMIISIAFLFLGGLGSIITGTVIGNISPIMNSDYAGIGNGISIFIGIVYMISAVLCIFPTVFMLRAAKAGKAAVALHDNSKMVEFARNTKSYWKFSGIVTIVALAFVVLCILGGIVAGVAVATTML